MKAGWTGSRNTERPIRTQGRRRILPAWFTIAELIVVIAVLAVLSAVGFLAVSSYVEDARDARIVSNVRNVYAAIAAESASTGNSPRHYVVNDPGYSLSGGVVVFDDTPVALAGGPDGAPGTNYSAGNPDYAKLRLSPDKFRLSASPNGPAGPFGDFAAWEASSADYLVVGAADLADESGGKNRVRTFVQTAGLLSNSAAFVAGDFPSKSAGSAAGLIKDPQDPSGTGALVDGAKTGGPAPCPAGELSGYPFPDLVSGQSDQVSKGTADGTLSASASCSFGTVSLSGESASCNSGYVPASGESGPYCVADVCQSTVPANAASTATSQSVSAAWRHSVTAWQCTFECSSGYSWDGNACRAACQIPSTDAYAGLAYALSSMPQLANGASLSLSGTRAFGVSPANGALTAAFSYSCSDGALTKSASAGSGSCQENYTWNADWTAPSCAADARTAACGGSVPANGEAATAATYQQTWNGTAWAPSYSWAVGAPACGYSCNANYVPSGGSCVGASRTASCTGLPSNAIWNAVSSITQTWNGSAWAPTAAGSYDSVASATTCAYKCSPNYTWNAVSCQPDTRYPWCGAADITVGTQIWAACNVGATATVTAYADNVYSTQPNAIGKFFQWGENVAWDYSSGVGAANNCTWNRDTQTCTTSDLSAWPTTVSDTTSGWSNRWFDWGGTSAPDTRGPCAPGYRVPTQTEWNTAYTALGSNKTTFGTTLKFPGLAGYRSTSSGKLTLQGASGYYWSSSPSSSFAYYMNISASAVNPAAVYSRPFGFSVRCLKN